MSGWDYKWGTLVFLLLPKGFLRLLEKIKSQERAELGRGGDFRQCGPEELESRPCWLFNVRTEQRKVPGVTFLGCCSLKLPLLRETLTAGVPRARSPGLSAGLYPLTGARVPKAVSNLVSLPRTRVSPPARGTARLCQEPHYQTLMSSACLHGLRTPENEAEAVELSGSTIQ